MHDPRPLLIAVAASAALVVLAPAIASAQQQDRQQAREAYERGTLAYKRGDFAAAAAAYREADDAAPSPVALQAALDAAVKADDPVLGGELLERAHGRKVEGALANSVKAAEAKLGHRAGRVHLTCGKPCTATVDGAALAQGSTRWASVGDHTVSIVIEGRQANVHAAVSVDQTAEVIAPSELISPPQTMTTPTTPPTTMEPPPPVTYVAQPQPALPPPRESTSHGIGRGWFWAGLGVTVAGAVGTTLFFTLASNDHAEFVAQSCATVGSAKCTSLANDGLPAQIVGNVFLGLGIVGAVWTVVSGVWLVHWSDSGVRAALGPGGGTVTWTQSF